MPPWVQAGGVQAWIARLKDPAQRAKVIAEMRDPNPTWENLGRAAGAEQTLFLGFNNPALRGYVGKSVAEVARLRRNRMYFQRQFTVRLRRYTAPIPVVGRLLDRLSR
jgi:N-acyl-D-aspartate/D-glutamate deacylase